MERIIIQNYTYNICLKLIEILFYTYSYECMRAQLLSRV